MMNNHSPSKITPEIVTNVEKEFQEAVTRIFGDNLHFAFIFGGIAKGYAKDFSHDVDMFVCLNEANAGQESAFRAFYFELHERYGFAPDPTDPGEIATIEKLRRHLDLLNRTKIRLTIEGYDEYEAIVWGDMFAGKVTAETGDLDALAEVQTECSDYPAQWRQDILDAIDPAVLESEKDALETINITLLFERFVTYLKRKDVPPTTPEPNVLDM
nr:hypothetical protein [Cytophagales bacterium]